MKKIKIFLLLIFAIACCSGIVACAKKVDLPKLAEPQNLQMDGRTLVWDGVENASSYIVYFNSSEHRTDDTSFDLSELLYPYAYEIEVMAVGDEKSYGNSDWVKYNYIPEKILTYGYDDRRLQYTLLEDKSGYEVSRGSLSYNDDRLKGFVNIPDYFCGLPVKVIADDMFYQAALGMDPSTGKGCNTVTTGVHLPKKLETIGERAFCYCISIEEINIPDTVTEIGEAAFSHLGKLKEINIPYGIKNLEFAVFNATGITKAVIPDSVVSIGTAAFAFSANLEEVILSDNLESVGERAFCGCPLLSKINKPRKVSRWEDAVFLDCSSLVDIPISNSIEYMGKQVFDGTAWYESQPDGFVIYGKDILYRYKGELPEGGEINDLPSQIKHIAGGAFADFADLVSIYLPDGVDFLGGKIFSECKALVKVHLPKGLSRIYINSFFRCRALTFIDIPEGVTTLDKLAFNFSSVKEAVFPLSLKSIGERAFPFLDHVFYKGTAEQWEEIEIGDDVKIDTICFYSEHEPAGEGTYWHYGEDNMPVIW